MATIFEAFKSISSGGDDVKVLVAVMKQYQEVRKVYHYEYTEEDKAALQACATDLRPLKYSFLPAGTVFWGLGRLGKPKQMGRMSRLGFAVFRLLLCGEVFRTGYVVGSYKQGMDCTQRLVSLPTPLGGEMAAILRSRDPDHRLLRFERQPAELLEDGSRPRVVNEANRLARIEHLKQELAAAKAGQVFDKSNERADERLAQLLRSREEVITEIEQGGGPTGAVSSGRGLEGLRPTPPRSYLEDYNGGSGGGGGGQATAGLSAAAGGGSLAAIKRDGGLVITDALPGAQVEEATAQLRATLGTGGEHHTKGSASAFGGGGGAFEGGGNGSGSGGMAGQDPLAVLLGGSGGGWGLGEGGQSEEERREAEARERRRLERKKGWWRRHSGHGGE